MPQLFRSSGQTPVDQQDIDQKKKLAQMIQMLSMQPNQQAQASNSPLIAGIAPILQALAAKKIEGNAKQKQEELNNSRMQDFQNIQQAWQGTPAQQGQPFIDEQAQFMGQESPEGLKATPDVAAVPGGREAMVRAMMGAQDPQLRMAGIGQAMQKPEARWEPVQGPRGSRIIRNTVTGEEKQVVGQESPQIVLGAMNGPKLSPTLQKELIESDETAQASTNVKSLLDEALKINETAYSGPFAKERATAMSWLPGDNKQADATVQIDNIMTGQALESLKSVFGGMPTEGERKILLEMQASPSKTPKQREDIIRRAKEAADKRIAFNQQKAKSIREGRYLKEAPVMQQTAPASNIDDLLKKY